MRPSQSAAALIIGTTGGGGGSRPDSKGSQNPGLRRRRASNGDLGEGLASTGGLRSKATTWRPNTRGGLDDRLASAGGGVRSKSTAWRPNTRGRLNEMLFQQEDPDLNQASTSRPASKGGLDERLAAAGGLRCKSAASCVLAKRDPKAAGCNYGHVCAGLEQDSKRFPLPSPAVEETGVQVVSLSGEVLLTKTEIGECTVGDLAKPLRAQKKHGILRLLLHDREVEDAQTLKSIVSAGLVEDQRRMCTLQAVVVPYMRLEFKAHGYTPFSRFLCSITIGPPAPGFWGKFASKTNLRSFRQHELFQVEEKPVQWVLKQLNTAVYGKALQTQPSEADDLLDFVRKTTGSAIVVSPLESYVCEADNLSERYKILIGQHHLELSHTSVMQDV